MSRIDDHAPVPTTEDYTPVHDHARLPWRFHARLTGADGRLIG